VLDAAIALFGRFGYNGTTIEMIQKESGVSVSSMYYIFGSKSGILEAMIARSFEQWRATQTAVLVRAAKGGAGGSAALEQAMDEIAAGIESRPGLLRLLTLLVLELDPEEHPGPVNDLFRLRNAVLDALTVLYGIAVPTAGGPAREPTPETLAEITLSTLVGAFIGATDPSATDMRTLLRHAVRMYARSVG